MKQRIQRKRYLINRRLQIVITAQLMAVLAGIGIFYTVAVHILSGDAMTQLNAEQTRAFLTRAVVVYFFLGAAILGTMTILVTHRIAGPIFVIRRAVNAMRKGDYTTRVALRRRDHLKDLAADVAALRDDLAARDEKVHDLRACLEEGDLDGARELVGQLGVSAGSPEAVEAAQEAEEVEEAAAEAPVAG